jgi:hypothetical protein
MDTTYTVSSENCSSFSYATSSSLLMLTAGPRDLFPRWRHSRKRLCSVWRCPDLWLQRSVSLVHCNHTSGHLQTKHTVSLRPWRDLTPRLTSLPVSPRKFWDSTSIMLQHVPSKSIPINNLWAILTSDATVTNVYKCKWSKATHHISCWREQALVCLERSGLLYWYVMRQKAHTWNIC